jgi:hypothetical protein
VIVDEVVAVGEAHPADSPAPGPAGDPCFTMRGDPG